MIAKMCPFSNKRLCSIIFFAPFRAINKYMDATIEERNMMSKGLIHF